MKGYSTSHIFFFFRGTNENEVDCLRKGDCRVPQLVLFLLSKKLKCTALVLLALVDGVAVDRVGSLPYSALILQNLIFADSCLQSFR